VVLLVVTVRVEVDGGETLTELGLKTPVVPAGKPAMARVAVSVDPGVPLAETE
jgi:hypothetical protein